MSADFNRDDFDDRTLERLRNAIASKVHGELGVLGGGNIREEDGVSNASIGASHEFGEIGINGKPLPIRSFLRQPLTEQMQKYLEQNKAFDKRVAYDIVRTGSIVPWLKLVMHTGEQIVFDAFNTQGFGKWKASVMALKKNHQTLVETQQLRNSISSRVKE